MRLNVVRSAHAASLYVVKSAWVNGKRTTKIVEKLGTEAALREKLGGQDPYEWANNYIAELNKKAEIDNAKIDVTFSPSIQIPKGEKRSFNAGYLFLQSIYYELGLNKICTAIKRKHNFKYDLNAITSRLLYSRIIYPGSKKSTFEDSSMFIEKPDFELHQIYRALSLLNDEMDHIQAELYKNSLKISSRNTDVIYYDCTNYFFETEEADEDGGLRQYGKGKENKPNPIVEMGLFMDANGIPLAFCINPGNTNEQITMTPLEKKLLTDFEMSEFVVCTDAGLASYDNRKFNNRQGRGFITVQSLKKLKEFQKEWALSTEGWHKYGEPGSKIYSIADIDAEKEHDTIFYKERWFNENDIEQRMIVTYSVKYMQYHRKLRERQIDRALKKINHPSELNKKRPTDVRRLINEERCTNDGEIADNIIYTLDENQIRDEERFDGFYAVCTNLENSAKDIVTINQRRWQIEECFRIMKHEFKARPAYLSRDERIKAHFLTCFLALIVYRYLEIKLGNGYTTEQITETLRKMNMIKLEGYGYIPSYDRTELTDKLNEKFGINTSAEITTLAKMRSICKETKKSFGERQKSPKQ